MMKPRSARGWVTASGRAGAPPGGQREGLLVQGQARSQVPERLGAPNEGGGLFPYEPQRRRRLLEPLPLRSGSHLPRERGGPRRVRPLDELLTHPVSGLLGVRQAGGLDLGQGDEGGALGKGEALLLDLADLHRESARDERGRSEGGRGVSPGERRALPDGEGLCLGGLLDRATAAQRVGEGLGDLLADFSGLVLGYGLPDPLLHLREGGGPRPP